MNFIKSFLGSPNKSNLGKLLVASSMERGEENYDDAPDQETFLNSTATSQPHDSEQAGDSHESTAKKSAEYIYIDYKVEKRDTLYSIALTYHISPEALMEDNKLESDTLVTGQRIRIRMKAKPESRRVQGTIVNKDDVLGTTTRWEYRPKTLKELRMKAEKIPQDHLIVYYCTSFGDAEGELTVEGTCLKFAPSITGLQTRSLGSFEDINEAEKRAKLLEVKIDVQDIAECNMMAVPSLLCEEHFTTNREFEKDYLLQVLLLTHGERSMGKYLDGLFQERKDKKTPYACVYFKLKSMTESMHEYTNEQKHSMLQEVQAKIMGVKHSKNQSTGPKIHSKIPHFEFLYDRFPKKDAELLRKVVKNSLWADSELINALGNARKVSSSSIEEEAKVGVFSGPSSAVKSKRIVPRLRQSSNIMNMEQFTELVNSVPELYQMLEWDLVYSNMVHGTSYTNLLRRGEDAAPFIVVIQDEDGFIFGAYGNEKLHYSEDYYGNGECFLFSFRDLEEISVFNWSKGNNRLFIFTSDQGLTFGSSPNYGLWVNNELAMGRSYPCHTFHNPRLSHKTDFIIKRIELWTIKEPVD